MIDNLIPRTYCKYFSNNLSAGFGFAAVFAMTQGRRGGRGLLRRLPAQFNYISLPVRGKREGIWAEVAYPLRKELPSSVWGYVM